MVFLSMTWPSGLRDKPPQAKFFRGTIFLNQSGIISNRNMLQLFALKIPKKIFSFSFLSKIYLRVFAIKIQRKLFISGAKRRKIFEAYLCCNLENCLTPPPPPPLFQCPKYWKIVHTPFMGGGGVNVTLWYIYQQNYRNFMKVFFKKC